MAADAQNAASHAAPAPAAPLVATPASALQKRRDDLQTAIVKDDLPRIAAFIRSGMQLDFNFDDEAPRQRSSESPLTMAVNRNKLEVARLLLDAGADAKRMDGFGRGPIHLVKSADMARLLVKAGADPNALNRRGYTGLAEAVWDGQLDRIDALLAAGARFDAPAKNPDVFTIAVQMRKGSLIPALVERGADPDAVAHLDRAALVSALDLAISQRLEAAEAERLRAFPIDEKEVAQRLEKFIARFGSQQAFERFLAREEVDEGQLAEVLTREIRAEKVLDSKVRLRARVSEAELHAYYDAHSAQIGVAFNQARAEIRDRLIQQKYAQLAAEEVASQRSNGNVRLIAPWAREARR